MNNRGLLRFIALIIVVALITGGFIYFRFLGNGVQVGTGDVTIDIIVNKTLQDQSSSNQDSNNSTNQTSSNSNNAEETISISPESNSNNNPPGPPGPATLTP